MATPLRSGAVTMTATPDLFGAHRPPRHDLRRIAGVGLLTLGALAVWTGAKASTAVLYGNWYRPYAIVTGALLIVSAFALWSARSWGAWLGAAVIVADSILVFVMGETRWPLLLLTLGIAFAALLSTRRRTP